MANSKSRTFLSAIAIAAAVLIQQPSTATAVYMTVDQYQKDISGDDTSNPGEGEYFRTLSQMFLDGVKQGLIGYAVQQKVDGITPYFCLPGKLALTREQAEDIMLRWVKDHPSYSKAPIDLALLEGLENTFPCKR
jgi:hypothetical protein